MRIDPSQIRDSLHQLSGGGAADAERGQKADKAARDAQPESAFEPIDRLLLKRLAVQAAEEAAGSAVSFADVQALIERTTQLMGGSPDTATAAQTGLLRDRLRDLLGE